jgi:hypothetical protein
MGLIAHTSLKASYREDLYFDSGCSRHMTGVENYLKDVKAYTTSFMTFRDGAKGEILGIGKLINNDLPNLENVLQVKGLTVNLISISQLCDQGLKVNFTKSECLVSNEEDEVLMKGTKSKDNCYLWVTQEEAHVATCHMQVESSGGKRYAFVVVDDFTRYTWVNFIREKSDTFEIFKTLSSQV